MSSNPWDRHAGWWQREFTGGADPEYEEQILPLVDELLAGAACVLDVGCGEGQVARRLATLGAQVVGIDPSAAQIVEAHERDGDPRYVRAAAQAVPFTDESFDAAVSCLVFEHLDPFEPAISEVARVLKVEGRFVLFVNHPLLQVPGSGWVIDHVLEEQYWRVGPYLPDDVATEEVAPGVELPFMHRPLHRYVNELAHRGLLVERMEEPPPPPEFLARAPEYSAAATIPRLLVLVTRKQRP